MSTPSDQSLSAALDRRPLSQRTRRAGPTPPRVEPALRRRVVLRARIAIDYPTNLEPADIRTWLAAALVAEAERLDVHVDLCQLALAVDPAWRTAGPADLLADLGHVGE